MSEDIGDLHWEESAIEDALRNSTETGETFVPHKAVEDGLSYTPPRDPPVIPSPHDLQGVEIAAGWAPSMEETDPDQRILPERIDRADLEIQEDVGVALRLNSETAHLSDISAQVNQGVVSLYGTVPSEDDIANVYAIVSDLHGVTKVLSYLEVAD